MEHTVIWVFGRNTEDYVRMKWEIMGVFGSEHLAAATTVFPLRDWIAPLALDEKLADEPFILPGSYFPRDPSSKPYQPPVCLVSECQNGGDEK